ncbi:MAG: hypothetical protein ABIQ56_00100 [Chitinophagaceae bacterium]
MAINLIEEIQKNLNLPSLQKIDPNTQEVKKPENHSSQDFLSQAAIPTVLLGLYKYSRSAAGNTEILQEYGTGNLLNHVFGDLTSSVVSKVANYTGNDESYVANEMERIAKEAARITKENLDGKLTGQSVKDFLTDQRHNILVYLPAGLQIGELLQDDTVDDRTNKMEGPVSGNMHWWEKLFSSSPPKEEDKHEAR